MIRRYSDEEVESNIIPRIVDALYPVLIPFEEQDTRIQARNHALMTELAQLVWRSFRNSVGKDD